MQKLTRFFTRYFLLCFLTVGLLSSAGAQPADIFKPLKVGQHINITSVNGGVEVSLLDDGVLPSGYVVVELGSTYLLVEDYIKITRTWIPVTSIVKVIHTRLPKPVR
ncbi:MAG: hypothetical protein CK528_02950 [Alcaligenaceae bacterium]|nr:MAG: hypothetical protein CK528_02950 [Alcaligenaceae bacterium]